MNVKQTYAIQYETNIDIIEEKFIPKNEHLTLGDLLKGFFEFYGKEFIPRDHVISIRSKTKGIINKRDWIEHLEESKNQLVDQDFI